MCHRDLIISSCFIQERLWGELTCKTAPWAEVKNLPGWKTRSPVLMREHKKSHSPSLNETISLSVRESQTFLKKKSLKSYCSNVRTSWRLYSNEEKENRLWILQHKKPQSKIMEETPLGSWKDGSQKQYFWTIACSWRTRRHSWLGCMSHRLNVPLCFPTNKLASTQPKMRSWQREMSFSSP